MSEKPYLLAKDQSSFLGIESVDGEFGRTISYWKYLESIAKWESHPTHIEKHAAGIKSFFKSYKVKISMAERDYEWKNSKF